MYSQAAGRPLLIYASKTPHSSSQSPQKMTKTTTTTRPPQPEKPRAMASSSTETTTHEAPPPPQPTSKISPLQPSSTKNNNKNDHLSKSKKIFQRVRSVFRSLPIISPPCKMPVPLNDNSHIHVHGGTRMTGTLFGHRKARVNLVIQENPRCLPLLILELAIPTGKLLRDMGLGLVRIALECEKKRGVRTKIMEEPIWAMYCNGRKSGYGVKREATEEDLGIMQMLQAVSMGAGVLPTAAAEGDLTYVRAQIERVIGSKDSETYYMLTPDGNNGPELSIFFIRI